MTFLRNLWCRTFHGHRDVMQPIYGAYFCRRCGIAFAVEWAKREARA